MAQFEKCLCNSTLAKFNNSVARVDEFLGKGQWNCGASVKAAELLGVKTKALCESKKPQRNRSIGIPVRVESINA